MSDFFSNNVIYCVLIVVIVLGIIFVINSNNNNRYENFFSFHSMAKKGAAAAKAGEHIASMALDMGDKLTSTIDKLTEPHGELMAAVKLLPPPHNIESKVALTAAHKIAHSMHKKIELIKKSKEKLANSTKDLRASADAYINAEDSSSSSSLS